MLIPKITGPSVAVFFDIQPRTLQSSFRLRTGVHAHNKPLDISSNKTGGYSGDLRWLVIYMWLFKGYSKIRTAQELSVNPTYVGKVRHFS